MKYLLQAIEAKRDAVQLSDGELRKLLVEVRSGKDDRIEFIDSMTRLVEELRSSEHAIAFLTKVAKRDAPDYYEVIKNPMDLGTMLRNVKSGRYKSKAQFMRDLDLIWDNCLTYNSEPTHPLRRSVQMLRAKANHLLTYVNDTNDVKEALSQWKSSSAASSARRSEGPILTGLPWADSPMDGSGNASLGSALINGRSMSMSLKRVNAALSDTPFEQRPALLRSVDGMSTFATLDESLSRADEHFERIYMANSASSEAGPSRRPLTSFDMEPSGGNGVAATVSGDLLRTLEMGTSGGILRSALTMGHDEEDTRTMNGKIASNGIVNGISTNGISDKQRKRRESESIPYPLELQESLEGIVSDEFQLGAWWNSTCGSSLLASGISPLPTSVQIDSKPNRLIGGDNRKRRRKNRNATSMEVFGGVEALQKNISTIARLRKTHAKFGALTSHIENNEPIPAALAVVSSDESETEDSTQKGEKEGGKRLRKRHKEMDMPAESMHDASRNPFAKLSSEGATEVLESKTQILLAHAGFEGAQRAAADVITDVASEYIMNLGRTIRMYMDQFAHEMSVEEIVLHSLFENGGMDVRNLESYIVDDVLRYGGKMSELLRKLQSSYRDTLNTTNLTMEDEAYFAENAEGNNDQIMSGTFAQGMGDDFFGFKEMGLDKELGIDMSRLIVPSKLFNKGAATAAGHARTLGRVGMSANLGAIGGARGGAGGASNEVFLFEPPPPYVPLTESAISAQIGLLQPFYRELIRNRGQWQQKSRRHRRDASGEGGEDGEGQEEEEDEEDEGEEEEDESNHRRNSKSILFLPEEEMERQRYKVPPNGKMPKRAMKVKGGEQGNNASNNERNRQSTTIAPASTAGVVSSTTSTKTKSSTSKKKKKDASS